MKRTVLIALVVAAALCAAPVWSQGGPPQPGEAGAVPPPPPAAAIDQIKTALSLTTDQATALKGVLTEIDATVQPLMEAAAAADKAVRDAFTAGDFTTAESLLQAAADAQVAVQQAFLDGWAKIKNSGVLTDDQFATLLAGPAKGAPPQGGSGGSSGGSQGRRR